MEEGTQERYGVFLVRVEKDVTILYVHSHKGEEGEGRRATLGMQELQRVGIDGVVGGDAVTNVSLPAFSCRHTHSMNVRRAAKCWRIHGFTLCQ